MQNQFKISGYHYKELRAHLFPGDGKEAIAIALCGRAGYGKKNEIMLVHRLLLIPHDECVRDHDRIEWPTERVTDLLMEAMQKDMAVVKVHSHPGGYPQFSGIDDVSDSEFFSSVYGWVDGDRPHASVVMLPDGSLFGRIINADLSFEVISRLTVADDNIQWWPRSTKTAHPDEAASRTRQIFGDGTYDLLREMKVGVVGCSGTGSVMIEQLVRSHVGHLVLVDPDHVEKKNLNRILNSRLVDAENQRYKVDLFRQVIDDIGLGTKVSVHADNLYESPEAILELSSCDVVIGCMDSAEGRDLLNKLSTFYLIPYIDMGIAITSNGKGGIDKIEGSVHYIQPGKSSLLTRKVYSMDDVKAESLKRKDAKLYQDLVDQGKKTGFKYVKDVDVDRPAVITVNMQIAATAANECLNRIHHYKMSAIDHTARIGIDVTDNFVVPEKESDFEIDRYLLKRVGRGNTTPLLETMELTSRRMVAKN